MTDTENDKEFEEMESDETLEKIEKEIIGIFRERKLGPKSALYILESIITTICYRLVFSGTNKEAAIQSLKLFIEHFQRQISFYEKNQLGQIHD